MGLHKQAKQFLNDSAQFAPVHTLTPEKFREVAVATAISETYDIQSDDHWLDGPYGPLMARVYRPHGKKELPVMIFYHGGGFVIGSVEAIDPMCRKLASLTGFAVVSVDYRKSPEYKFPIPVEESYFALEWVYQHAPELKLDRKRLVVAGESVGGNLAAVISQQARDTGGPAIAHQILLCPLTNWHSDDASRRQFESGYFLEQATLDYFAGHHFNKKEEQFDPLASPLLGKLHGLPPALIVTAEYDPLRDEGELYGFRLIENGTTVTMKRYPGMIHLFYALTDLFDDGHDVYAIIRKELTYLL